LDHELSENLKDGIGDNISPLVYHKWIIESVHEPVVKGSLHTVMEETFSPPT